MAEVNTETFAFASVNKSLISTAETLKGLNHGFWGALKISRSGKYQQGKFHLSHTIGIDLGAVAVGHDTISDPAAKLTNKVSGLVRNPVPEVASRHHRIGIAGTKAALKLG